MGKGQTRGQYGEMQLEQLLKHAGLLEGTHFQRQDSRAGVDGVARPDVSILLAGGGEVLIDAKFPWDAFFEAMGTNDQAEKARQSLDEGKTVFAAKLDMELLKELFLLTANST